VASGLTGVLLLSKSALVSIFVLSLLAAESPPGLRKSTRRRLGRSLLALLARRARSRSSFPNLRIRAGQPSLPAPPPFRGRRTAALRLGPWEGGRRAPSCWRSRFCRADQSAIVLSIGR